MIQPVDLASGLEFPAYATDSLFPPLNAEVSPVDVDISECTTFFVSQGRLSHDASQLAE